MSKRKPKRATPATVQPASARRNRRPWMGAALALVVVVVGGWWWLNGRPQLATSSSQATLPDVSASVILTPQPELATGAVDWCRVLPKFVKAVGLPAQVIVSTSERQIKGLVMYDPANPPTPENPRNGVYQHESWDDAGYLGHVVTDEVGNLYTFPAPRVSLVDNPPGEQNVIYKVDTDSGEMAKWLELPAAAAPNSPENPFGVLGLAYDCETGALYASSVAGSTRSREVGRIYRIDVQQVQIVSQYGDVDAFGLGVFNGSTGKRLYFGAARLPEVRSLAIDPAGNFVGEPRHDLSLAGLGPKGDDRARRILFDPQGNMMIRAIEFNFNLIATSEQMQNEYRFHYNPLQDSWNLETPAAEEG